MILHFIEFLGLRKAEWMRLKLEMRLEIRDMREINRNNKTIRKLWTTNKSNITIIQKHVTKYKAHTYVSFHKCIL